MDNIIVKIIDTHDKIIDIIDDPVNMVNFDWHRDYPPYAEKVIDVDFFVKQIDPVYYDQNWAAVLASKGLLKNYYWVFPHDYAEPGFSQILRSKNGDCIAYNIKFDNKLRFNDIGYVSIDMDFFGNRKPVDWSPSIERMELLMNVLGTLKADDIMMIISISRNWVNYDVDKFLDEMIRQLYLWKNIVDIERI